MTAGPTTGASELAERSWHASRFWARVVGVGVFVAPLATAWIALLLVRDQFFKPVGVMGVVLWVLQSVAVASIVAAAVERVARRLLPLRVLLGMSLTFPDHAPSRFKVALRSGTLKKLKSRIPDISDGGTASVQEAAEHAIQLVTMLGKHERLTRGHTERVRAYSDLIAAELGLSEGERNKLAWAAMLHDIGKLAVPAEILNKDSRPTDVEWAILASHPSEGLDLLAPLHGWLGDWLLAASEHHERWDGEGYPKGLSGLDISLAGRIVAVADAYDVITSHRSYKKPMSIDAARSELVSCAGNQFDPAIVRAMLTASKSDKAGLARFAGLLELRTVSQAISSVSAAPAAVAASIVVLPALMGAVSLPIDQSAVDGPPEVAFVQPADQTTEPTDPSAGSLASTTLPSSSTLIAGESITTVLSPATTAATEATSTTSFGNVSSSAVPAAATGTINPSIPGGPTTSPTKSTSTTATALTTSTSTTSSTTTTAPVADDCQRLRNGEIELSGADLVDCDVAGFNFTNVDLSWADLTGADLRNTQFTSFNMSNAILNDARLDGAELINGSATSMTAMRLEAAGITIANVNLSSSSMMDANFFESELEGVSLANASLSRSNFAGSELEGVDFSGASLTDADFRDADAEATNFANTNSQAANFDDSDISESSFFNALIAKASFVDTDAEAIILTSSGVNKANFTRTNLLNASGTPGQAWNATYDMTICPEGATQNTNCWP